MKPFPAAIPVLLALLAAPAPAAAQAGLVGGRVANRTGLCGAPEPLVVQLSGDLPARLDLPGGAEVPVSLARGLYAVSVLRADGSLAEETATLVTAPGFVLEVGCPGVPLPDGPLPAAPAPAAPGNPGPSPAAAVPVVLANTTNDCGDPRTVEFLLARRPAGGVAPGRTARAQAPAEGATVDVVAEGRRLLTFYVARPRAGQVLAHGCTFPDAAGAGEGVPVAFDNTTDACPDIPSRRALTLWVDGLPVVGVPPGGKTAVRVPPGRHDFEVRVGWTRERVVRGQREVTGPFRIHYGCGR